MRNKLKSFFFFLFLLAFSLPSIAQKQVGLATVEISANMRIDEAAIEAKSFQLLNAADDAEKVKLNQELRRLLLRELNKPEALKHAFAGLTSISVLNPSDSSFRLFNWNIPWEDGTYSYECGLLKAESNSTQFFFFGDSTVQANETRMLENKKWLPGLFYTLIETQSELQRYYTLLTWDGNNLLSNKKRIEVLWFDRAGNPRFGAPLFSSKNGKEMRVHFEYGGQNSMKLQYNEALNRIEFDHLSPPNNTLEGIYEYYGADLSFDGYVWEKNRWVHVEDINIEEGIKKRKKEFRVDKSVIKEKRPLYAPSN